jgi:hypothetical protein
VEATAVLIGTVYHCLGMMVPKNEKQGLIQVGNDKIKVIQGEIPRAEDNIHVGKTVFYRIRVYQRVNLIGNTQNFHVMPFGKSTFFPIKESERSGFTVTGTAIPFPLIVFYDISGEYAIL